MKKVFFSFAIVAAGLLVASCGNKGAANGTEGSEAVEALAELDEDNIGPGMLTTEKFTVEVPEGWKVVDKKVAGRIRMRPADNDFADFDINDGTGDIAEGCKNYQPKGERTCGGNKFATYQWGDYEVAALKVSDEAYLLASYKEIDDAVLNKVLASIKAK